MSNRTLIVSILCALALGACATDQEALDQPPFGESERIGAPSGDGKSDASSAISVKARTSGYRSGDEFIGSDGFIPGTNCDDTRYDVEVTYENKSLPWGVSIELVSAMQGVEWSPEDVSNMPYYEYFDWKYEERKVASSSGPWQWRSARGQSTHVGGGKFSSMHFAIRITYPDGTVRWDNGGSAWGYYEVKPPTAPCEMSWTPYVSTTPADWMSVPANVIQKW